MRTRLPVITVLLIRFSKEQYKPEVIAAVLRNLDSGLLTGPLRRVP